MAEVDTTTPPPEVLNQQDYNVPSPVAVSGSNDTEASSQSSIEPTRCITTNGSIHGSCHSINNNYSANDSHNSVNSMVTPSSTQNSNGTVNFATSIINHGTTTAIVMDTTSSTGARAISANTLNSCAGTSSTSAINSSGISISSRDGGYSDSALVWVRLGQSWWPGSVVALERCPQDFLRDLKRTPLAVVKFFEENG